MTRSRERLAVAALLGAGLLVVLGAVGHFAFASGLVTGLALVALGEHLIRLEGNRS